MAPRLAPARPAQVAQMALAIVLTTAASSCAPAPADSDSSLPELHYLETAEQVGPVAYRDPLGAISPDGRWLAYVERDKVIVGPVEGGGRRVMGPGTSSIRFLTWTSDSRHVAARERVFDRSEQMWWLYDRVDGSRERLWPERSDEPDLRALDMLAWSADGSRVAGATRGGGTSSIWVMDSEGATLEEAATGTRLSFPAWSPDGRLACLSLEGDHQRLHFPCGDEAPFIADQDVFAQSAFSPDGVELYYGVPGEDGFLDWWARPTDGGAGRMLTSFVRDAYAPSVGADGQVLFKTQDYRVFVATAPAEGGETTPLTSFQSETPSWNWDGSEIAFTFGTWRHVTDDFHYPDIAQHIGIVASEADVPFLEPTRIVRQSHSEDQGMNWSPNGEWIAFHTHVDSDDIWLMRADGTGEARMISEDGSETGWARWSRDGRWITYPSYRDKEGGGRAAYVYVIGIDQETGDLTMPQTRVDLGDFDLEIIQSEWADDGDNLIIEAAAGIGQKSLWRVPRTGGTPQRFHTFSADQIHAGISVSPDGRWVAYVDRAPDGFFQIFRVPSRGGAPQQLTYDPTHKTQPNYSPVGDRIAFTVFSYKVHFWGMTP